MYSLGVKRLHPMDLGEILDQAFALYRANFVLFAGIVAVLAVPQTIITIALTSSTSSSLTTHGNAVNVDFGSLAVAYGGSGLLTLFFSTLITGALARAISARYLSQEITVGQAYSSLGFGTFAVLVIASILLGIIVVIGVFLPIPILTAIFLYVRFAFISQVVVLERRGVFASFGRSWSLVKGTWWRVFGITLVLAVIVGAIEGVLGGLAAGFLAFGHTTISQSISGVIGILVRPIQLGGMTLLYYDLRIRKEGFDLEYAMRDLESGQPVL